MAGWCLTPMVLGGQTSAAPQRPDRTKTVWTYSDYPFREYSLTDTAETHVLDRRPLAGIPDNWLHLTIRPPQAAMSISGFPSVLVGRSNPLWRQ
jgi:hypothetical protein